MAESFDWENPKSLGLRIVQILTRQIDGNLTLDRSEGGTKFDLRFLAAARQPTNSSQPLPQAQKV